MYEKHGWRRASEMERERERNRDVHTEEKLVGTVCAISKSNRQAGMHAGSNSNSNTRTAKFEAFARLWFCLLSVYRLN